MLVREQFLISLAPLGLEIPQSLLLRTDHVLE